MMDALLQHPLVTEAVRLGSDFVETHGQTGKRVERVYRGDEVVFERGDLKERLKAALVCLLLD